MKKIKSYDKFVKSKFNPKPSNKTYGWMPDPKTKVTKVKEELDLRKAIAGAALGTSLAMGNPVQARTGEETKIEQSQQVSIDSPEVYKERISEISKLRNEKCQDKELCFILDNIKYNLESGDSAKFIELFNRLKSHIEGNYGTIINKEPIEAKISQDNIIQSVKNMSLFEIMGWLGSICLAICGIPQAWQSYKEKNSDGISWGFVLLWAFGEIFALAYVYDKLDLPLLLNYATNILILAVILYYKVKPGKPMNESTVVPGPKVDGSKKITLSEEQIRQLSEEPQIQELISDGLATLLPPDIWFSDLDKKTEETIMNYLK